MPGCCRFLMICLCSVADFDEKHGPTFVNMCQALQKAGSSHPTWSGAGDDMNKIAKLDPSAAGPEPNPSDSESEASCTEGSDGGLFSVLKDRLGSFVVEKSDKRKGFSKLAANVITKLNLKKGITFSQVQDAPVWFSALFELIDTITQARWARRRNEKFTPSRANALESDLQPLMEAAFTFAGKSPEMGFRVISTAGGQVFIGLGSDSVFGASKGTPGDIMLAYSKEGCVTEFSVLIELKMHLGKVQHSLPRTPHTHFHHNPTP